MVASSWYLVWRIMKHNCKMESSSLSSCLTPYGFKNTTLQSHLQNDVVFHHFYTSPLFTHLSAHKSLIHKSKQWQKWAQEPTLVNTRCLSRMGVWNWKFATLYVYVMIHKFTSELMLPEDELGLSTCMHHYKKLLL
jgi:hypothetical protein